jgi:NADH-quinone oxidoreductase subunit G
VSDRNGQAVTVSIDGGELTVPAGTLIIRAAEALGIEIPRFCEHPYLDPIGACRQCIVEVEGQRKPITACTTPVADGMVVRTQHTSDMARTAQVGMLELLLINHPLDCPVCDRGGECPLQDQALAWGPGESRYVDPKRVYEKPIPLSSLVLLDRERCVLCTRCTRFCDQISGERFIDLFDRGPAEQVAIAPGEDFRSPFSGNTVQICPVGALTSSTYRFAARPFDVKSQSSVCPHCACGCSIRVDVRRGEVVRHQAVDNPDVNDAWLCDKGRYAFRFPDRDRIETPMLRVPGLEPAPFSEVLGTIASRARGGRIAFLAGGRLTDEDAFALSKLARMGFRTNDLDHRSGGRPDVPVEVERVAAAGTPVTYADVERASTIIVIGLDTREELPILHLRIRKAVRDHGAKVFVVHPRHTALAPVAEHIPCPPGGEADVLEQLATAHGRDTPPGRAADALDEARESAVVLAGPRLAGSVGAVSMAVSLALSIGARFALLPRRAGDRGALRAGIHPALLPGGRLLRDPSERGEVERIWGGTVPAEPGRDVDGILAAAAGRELDVLYLIGADPLTDFPDADLARRALANVPFLVVQDVTLGEYRGMADAVLPASAYLEKEGHFTDWEGRGQRLSPVRAPIGLARSDWQIFQELSEVAGTDMGFSTLEALHDEMGSLLSGRHAALQAGPSRREPGPVEGLTLFSYPLLVDEGRLSVDATELKAALGQEPFLEMHPDDASRLGVDDGADVRVATERAEVELPVRVTDGVAQGAIFVPWNQPGLRANALFAGTTRIGATVDPAGQPQEAAS